MDNKTCKNCHCNCHCDGELHNHHYDGEVCTCNNCHCEKSKAQDKTYESGGLVIDDTNECESCQ